MTEREVMKTLQEISSEFGIEDLEQFIKSAWQSADLTDFETIAELVERAVENFLDECFLWIHVIETENCEQFVPDGWFSFVAVHPRNKMCLTFQDTGPWKDISCRVQIRTLQDAVNAVMTLTELIKSNLQKGGMDYGADRA